MQIPLKEGIVRLVDLDRMQEVPPLLPSRTNPPPNQIVSAPDGRKWAVFHQSWDDRPIPQVVELFCEAGAERHHWILEHPASVNKVTFSADSSQVLSGAVDRAIRVWRTADGGLERTIPVPAPFTEMIYFSPDAKIALLGQDDRILQCFDLESEKLFGATFHSPSQWHGAFDPTGERIAITGGDQSIRVWNIRTGEPLSPPFKHAGTGINLDWSPDGRRLVTSGLSSEARIWDAATGEQLLSPLALSAEPTRAARWSADGRFIVTRSDDNLVRVWDAATAEAVTPKLRQEGYVRLATLRANDRLIVGVDPNLVLAWDLTETRLPTDVIADYAKLVSGRRLNAAGVMLPLKPDELAELCRSLRTRAPELFQ